MSGKNNIYYDVFMSSPNVIAISDYGTGEFIEVNTTFYQQLGYQSSEIIGALPSDIGIFPNEDQFQSAFQKVISQSAFSDHKIMVKDRGGTLHTGLFSGRVYEASGKKYVITTMSDISRYTEKSQLTATEQQLETQTMLLEEKNRSLETVELRNEAILSVLPDLLFIYNKEGYFVDCRTSDDGNLLMPREAFVGRHLSEVMPPDISRKALASIKRTLKTGTLERFEYELQVDGEPVFFETRMVKSARDEVMAIVRDVTSSKKEQQLILDLSYKDPLTGVYNRRYFDESVERINEATYLPTSLFMIDVNGLKLTNDAFGHLIGDELLQLVADNLLKTCPPGAMVSRIGGDEFVVVITNFDHEKSHKLTDQIYESLEAVRCREAFVSVSVGFETRTSLDVSLRETFIEAENHMFRRKLVESQSMRHHTVIAILNTLNEKNSREKRHSDQVSKLCRQIGKAMGYPSHELKEIEMAGLLHDIGKIAIREDVLNKPGKLTDEEYSEVKRHSESGYHILKTVDDYSSMADSILSHHERMDGKGYPRQLMGDQIPQVAKIISVADAYEAMVSDRSYREGTTHEKAIEELLRCSGTQFDPIVVQAFVASFETNT